MTKREEKENGWADVEFPERKDKIYIRPEQKARIDHNRGVNVLQVLAAVPHGPCIFLHATPAHLVLETKETQGRSLPPGTQGTGPWR